MSYNTSDKENDTHLNKTRFGRSSIQIIMYPDTRKWIRACFYFDFLF